MNAVTLKEAGGYEPSSRILRLWDRARSQAPELYRPLLAPYRFLEGWMADDSQPLPIRKANALAHVIESMPVIVFPDELLVGESGDNQCEPMLGYGPASPEYWQKRAQTSVLTEEQTGRMIRWLEDRPFDYCRLAPVAPMPPELKLAQEHGVVEVWGTDLNHSIRGYEKVLRLGFGGLRAEVDEALEGLSLIDPDAPAKRANLIAFRSVCLAAEGLGLRYAEEARRLADACQSPEAREEWLAIATICERVPAHPARNFREALQALLFAHIVTIWEDGINANGIGRIDQMIWPYLEADLAAGRLDLEEASELLAALWVKLYRPYDVQQMMVGGQLPDGTDATNPLSYLVLDVTEGLGFVRCLSARLHRHSPRRFVERCLDLVARGGGIPFFFNDEALVPALVRRGIPVEEARGYAAIGCIEITIPGKANPHAVSHWINVAKCLELALNDGCDMLDGVRLGPATGNLSQHGDFEAVLEALSSQLEYFAQLAVYGSNSCEIAHRSQYRLPYLSLLTEDCVGRGKDIIEGGARYNYHSSAAMGIPNAADSLAALKQALYDDEVVSREEMLEALRSDFEGKEDLRSYLRNRVPKYGNDVPLPDDLAARLTREYCETMAQHRTPSGGTFFSHLFTFTLMLSHGRKTAASPDGRKAGEPLAYSMSPGQGRDVSGLTAVTNSLARIPHDLAAASSSAIIEIDPGLFEGPSKQALVDLIVTAVDSGVGQLQFNVVSAETLREAQKDPDRYRSLCVRVSGFSQQFCLLDREMQEHIISRTKHKR